MKDELLTNFIPINRQLFEHHLWCEEREFSRFEAWLYLLKEARFEDTKLLDRGKLVLIKRGQVYASIRFLATAFGWSVKRVRTFLDLIQSDNMIERETVKGTGQGIITICNYDIYNIKPLKEGKQGAQQGHSKGTKSNKENKENNNIPPLSPLGGKGYEKMNFDFLEKDFEEPFLSWLDYKRERGEKYKSQKAIELCYQKLLKHSSSDPQKAISIVHQSMANNWSGLFEIKQSNSSKQLSEEEFINNLINKNDESK